MATATAARSCTRPAPGRRANQSEPKHPRGLYSESYCTRGCLAFSRIDSAARRIGKIIYFASRNLPATKVTFMLLYRYMVLAPSLTMLAGLPRAATT